MISIEFYGIPRLRAGTPVIRLQADTVGEALQELGRVCPALENLVLKESVLHRAYQLSLNGEQFITDPTMSLRDGDVLLLLSADAGG